MDNDLEFQDYKFNCLKDKEHQENIYKLCESHKNNQIKYIKECIIANTIVYPKYKINNGNSDF